jgi:uncharacterized LabA/DUF88 family protein
VSPRLRSNWRRPAPQQTDEAEPTAGTPAPAEMPVIEIRTQRPSNGIAASLATRLPAREAGRDLLETSAPAEAAPTALTGSDPSMPASTRPPSRRGGARPRVQSTPAAETPAPEPERPDSAAEVSTPALDAGNADGPRPMMRQRAPRRAPPRSGVSAEPAPAEAPTAESNGLRSAASTAPPSVEFEPLPPPTKRKAPRTAFGIQRLAHAAENAVDWALGRTLAEADETTVVEPPSAPIRRRRTRRGHRGHGGGEAPASDDRSPEGSEPPAALPEAAAPPAPPARPVQLRQPRPPVRDERASTPLSTFESLVARQNVVLDALLAKVSSFASMEHALMAIERRLSSQGFGTAGASAPRVGIFVDVPNIIYAAERIGVTIDFEKLLHMLTRGRELVRASAYAPISDDPQQRFDTQKFVQPFVRRGYRIVTKPLKRFSDGTMKGNFDVELAMDILMMSDRLDVVSLISGDGDFSRLVEIVGSKGLRVEVVAFGSSTSAELRAICDDYLDISDYLTELT